MTDPRIYIVRSAYGVISYQSESGPDDEPEESSSDLFAREIEESRFPPLMCLIAAISVRFRRKGD